jgi:Uma2 family endonuclease
MGGSRWQSSIEATDLSTFPDVTVVYGSRNVSTLDQHAVVNPTLLVEVTNRSTEDYDRGEKLSHYKQIPGLNAVLIASHRRAQVTVVERHAGAFRVHEVRLGEFVRVPSIQLEFSVDELYRGITLEEG